MVIPGKEMTAPHGVQGEARPGIQLRRRREPSDSVLPGETAFDGMIKRLFQEPQDGSFLKQFFV